MSTKNPYTMPGRDGMVTHKRFPKQARTQRDVKRIKDLKPATVVEPKTEVSDVRS